MKTTVEIPDQLLSETRRYAADRGKTFKSVLEEALNLLVRNGGVQDTRPGWEKLFGAFAQGGEIDEVQAIIDEEFSRINPEDWK